MSDLHTLPKIVEKKARRLGRGIGSGAGAKSGRGTTRHQTARTTIPNHFEGGQAKMTKRFPLLRGKGKNKSILPDPCILNVGDLNKLKKGSNVDIDTLVKESFVDKIAYTNGVKILSKGILEHALTVNVPTSKKAQEKIEKAGGKVIIE